MTIHIYKETNVDIDLESIVEILNEICQSISIKIGEEEFIYNPKITEKNFDKLILKKIINESKNDLFSIFITDNEIAANEIEKNMFYFSNDKGTKILLSFYQWEQLTNYSKNTGLVFFIADLLCLEIDIENPRHNFQETSCIYGFTVNKSEINQAIESARICGECQERVLASSNGKQEDILHDIVIILDAIKQFSIANFNNDFLEYWKKNKKEQVKIFFSYAHKDREFLEEFKEYIKIFERNGFVERWDDNELIVGEKWDDTIKDKIYSADIIIFLLSSTSLASDYIYKNELRVAFDLKEMNETYVAPIIIKDCLWDMTEFKDFQILPLDGKAVNSWNIKEEAWTSVARGLKKAIDNIIEAKQSKLEKSLESHEDRSSTKVEKVFENKYGADHKLLLKFLDTYSRWWFNIPRIINWGSERDNFKNLKFMKPELLKEKLDQLWKDGKVDRKKSTKNTNSYLYKLKD